jgi:hypothetical protein
MAVILSILIMESAEANWWYGNSYSGQTFGGFADISTSANHIRIIDGRVYSWVSTPGMPDWVQTGWGYDRTRTKPFRYYEFCHDGCSDQMPSHYILQTLEDQDWGTTVRYKISWEPGTTDIWCAYIANVQKACFHVFAPPSPNIQALSEIQNTSGNEMDATFDNVYYADSSLIYMAFTQNGWIPQSPPFPDNALYKITNYCTWHYRNYGYRQWIFLPQVSKS